MAKANARAFTPELLAAASSEFGLACEIRPLPSLPFIAASADGRVFSCAAVNGSEEVVREKTQFPTKKGRRFVHLSDSLGHRRYREVSHVVAEAFGLIRPGPSFVLRHLDDNPANNCVGNLAWGTHQDNRDDAVRNGRMAQKLTPVAVVDCRRAHASGQKSFAELAREHGVSGNAMRSAVLGLTWRHIAGGK